MKFIIPILIFFICSCKSKTDFSEVRRTIEMSEDLVSDYKFCYFEKDEKRVKEKMYYFVTRCDNDDFFNYFKDKNIKDKTIISKILIRNLCQVRNCMRRPVKKLTNKQLKKMLDYSINEILSEERGIHVTIRNSKGKIIRQY
jgi:hypothetical protein